MTGSNVTFTWCAPGYGSPPSPVSSLSDGSTHRSPPWWPWVPAPMPPPGWYHGFPGPPGMAAPEHVSGYETVRTSSKLPPVPGLPSYEGLPSPCAAQGQPPPAKAAVATATEVVAPKTRARRCWTATTQLRAPVVQAVTTPGVLRPRLPHNGVLKDIATIHRRTGVTNPLVFRTLVQSALGIGKISARAMQRFQSSASSLSATKRTAIRREASDTLYSDPPPGSHASVDLTHFFERNSDGYVCAAIFLDRSTWSLWLGPMKNKTCSEFVRVLDEYRLHARTIHGVELREVRADNDPCFTDNRSGVAHNVVELDRYLRELPPSQSIVFTHSPPETQSLNPVECSVRQLYHLMNFYLQCGNLSSLCWMDMLMAATFVMNRLPHPQSRS